MKNEVSMEKANCILVDLKGLMAMLSCGRIAAERIANDSAAIIRVGRRKLYNVEKIKAYLNSNAGGNQNDTKR